MKPWGRLRWERRASPPLRPAPTAKARRLAARSAAIGVGAAIAVLALGLVGILGRLELKGLDFLFLLRWTVPADPAVVIVAVDYESLQALGASWPWPRRYHARLIDELARAGARVIGFDLLFTEATEPPQDRLLAEAAARAGNVVWASSFSTVRQAQYAVEFHDLPLPLFRKASPHTGYVDLRQDPDGYTRRASPLRFFHGEAQRAFGLKVLEGYEGVSSLGLGGSGSGALTYAGREIPLDGEGALLINFLGPPRTIPTVPYHRVLRGEIPAQVFRDKIVLVGGTSPTLRDRFFTPFYSRIFRETRDLMPGVEIHANVIETIRTGRYLRRTGPVVEALLILLLGASLGLITGGLRPLLALPLALAIPAAYLGAGVALFLLKGVWVPMVGPLLAPPLALTGAAILRLRVAERERDFIRRTFRRYVSPEVAEEILKGSGELGLGGKRTRVTVLFADVRGFTTLCERIAPEEVVEILNDYFGRMSEIILRQGGTLDKYIGDAIMAFWGAPLSRGDDAVRAVAAALEMQAAAEGLHEAVLARTGLPFRIAIGINSGEAVVGSVGSPHRLEYTAIGDQVNIAARLEGLGREYPGKVLISQATYDEIKFRFEAQRVGAVTVKGRTEPVQVYAVEGPRRGDRAGTDAPS